MSLKIYFEDEAKLVNDADGYLKKFMTITAAGGVVKNDKGQILMIFRRGKWDLPKGKAEENEPLELCAEREIMEETGITDLILHKFLLTTFHTYTEKDKPVLKDTHWYLFTAPGEQQTEPQSEEDISRIEWVDPSELHYYTNNTYQLIKDVLQAAGYEI